VGSVENGVHEALAFLRPRTGLFTDLATLKKLRDDVEARYAYEVGKETGLQLGLEDEAEAPPPPIAPDTVKSRLGVKAEDERRFPGDGRYQSADGKKAVVVIRSGVVGADFQKAEEAVAKVSEVVRRVNPASFDPAGSVGPERRPPDRARRVPAHQPGPHRGGSRRDGAHPGDRLPLLPAHPDRRSRWGWPSASASAWTFASPSCSSAG
jgi:hypothetical protein